MRGSIALACLVFISTALCGGSVRAEPVVVVTAQVDTIPLTPRTIVIDPAGGLDVETASRLLAAPDAMVESTVRSHGYVPDTLWGRVVLDVAPEASGLWYLSLELPNFDRLDVYSVPNGSGPPVPYVALGDRVPDATEIRTRFHIAPIDLPAGRTVLLLRGRTDSTLTLDLKLRRLEGLLAGEQDYFALQAFYLGVAAIIGLGALGLLFYNRQRIYLIYLINLVSHTLLWLLVNGTGPGHLWPGLADRIHIDPHPFVGLTVFGTGAFAAEFLSTARIPSVVKLGFQTVAVLGLAVAVLCVVMPEGSIYWSSRLASTIVTPSTVVLFALTAVGVYRGEPAARPLMLTWVGLAAAVVLAVLRDVGIVPSNTLTLTGPQLGGVFEMLVFAYMLLDRLGRLQREKEELQRAALDTAREHEAVLEQRVADRTVELDLAVEREKAARLLQQQFVAMISHEFRTPLAIIDGAAQNIDANDRGKGRVQKIRAAVQRLLRMIDTCLIDERVESGTIQLRREVFDVRDLVEEAVDVVRAASPDRRLDLRLPSGPLAISADPRLIEIAVGNLLENAVKYSPADTVVTVSVSARQDAFEIAVDDEGPGVPVDDRERIFEKYHRSDRTEGIPGAGLGLHLVRAIVEAHRGSVRHEPRVSGGSRFAIRMSNVDSEAHGALA